MHPGNLIIEAYTEKDNLFGCNVIYVALWICCLRPRLAGQRPDDIVALWPHLPAVQCVLQVDDVQRNQCNQLSVQSLILQVGSDLCFPSVSILQQLLLVIEQLLQRIG